MKKEELLKTLFQFSVLTAIVMVAMPDGAWAAGGLDTLASGFKSSAGTPILTMVAYICYLVGTVLGLSGVMGLKAHAEKPDQKPLGPGLAKLGAGGALLASPSVVSMVKNTGGDVLGTAGSLSVGTIGM